MYREPDVGCPAGRSTRKASLGTGGQPSAPRNRERPIGSIHRLANQGCIPLELIEVQTGSYLADDDIVRLDEI